jgi:ubiquinone/menaquinone biosynthesis C-methylase UbiE
VDHADHVRLLSDGVPREAGTWADLGAGEGAFTLALADLLPLESEIIAIDRDAAALRELVLAYIQLGGSREGLPKVSTSHLDFVTGDLGTAWLDGVVMANSLHFVKEKAAVLARVHRALRPGGRLLLVEYDTDRGNAWVPYPLSFDTWRAVAVQAAFSEPRLLATHPSRFLRRIYSAASTRT